jgi:hypothetical protein
VTHPQMNLYPECSVLSSPPCWGRGGNTKTQHGAHAGSSTQHDWRSPVHTRTTEVNRASGSIPRRCLRESSGV